MTAFRAPSACCIRWGALVGDSDTCSIPGSQSEGEGSSYWPGWRLSLLGPHNKALQPGAQTTHMYCLAVLEAGNPRPRGQWVGLFWDLSPWSPSPHISCCLCSVWRMSSSPLLRSHIDIKPTLMTSFYLNSIFHNLFSKYSHSPRCWGLRLPHTELWRIGFNP